MKKFYVSLVALCSMTVLTSCSDKDDDNNLTPPAKEEVNLDDQMPYTVKQLPVSRDGQSAGTVAIRFYEDMPSVPYISVADFQSLMLPGSTATVTKTGNGTYHLANPGSTATVNTVNETFTIADFLKFTNLMETVQPGMDNAYLDGAPYVRFSHQTVTDGSETVTFNFSKYGINLRGDEQGVYFPFTTLADIFADLHYHNAACNGKKVAVSNCDDGNTGIGAFDDDFSADKIMAQETRTADLAAYSYSELCFTIDHFYGMPGRSPYEAGIKRDGLDKTLDASEDGKIIKKLLQSTKMEEYLTGFELMQLILEDGGHTKMWDESKSVVNAKGSLAATTYPNLYQRYLDEYFEKRISKSICYFLLMQCRESRFNNDQQKYHKKGNTAICHFDVFHPTNVQAWRNYYNGTISLADIKNDALIEFLDALKKADDDPEVKNFIVDLTLNMGGSLDIVMAMTSLMYGESFARCVNTFTGQRIQWNYDVDRNFDGKFDEQDKDVHYDLNFCILTSDFSFSCGNMLPALCKDAGLLVAGQKSGGGGCGICIYRTAEGFNYQISSARGRLADKQWQNIDGGIVPNVEISTDPVASTVYQGKTYEQPALYDFYDLDKMSAVISNFYTL